MSRVKRESSQSDGGGSIDYCADNSGVLNRLADAGYVVERDDSELQDWTEVSS